MAVITNSPRNWVRDNFGTISRAMLWKSKRRGNLHSFNSWATATDSSKRFSPRPFSCDSVLTKKHLLSRLAEATGFALQPGGLHHARRDLMSSPSTRIIRGQETVSHRRGSKCL